MNDEQKSYSDPLTKSEVDSLIEMILQLSNNGGYLDHTVRAVEEYVIKKRKKAKFYRISKSIMRFPVFKKGQGCVYIFQNGAIIKYSDLGDGVDKRFAIGHELGHIMLHYKHDAANGNSLFIKDPVKETQASYFAMRVINDRQDLLLRKRGILPLSEERVKVYCSLYDSSLLE